MQRNQLLSEQLKPSGEFANGGKVFTTGNGCFTMIGWLHKLLEHHGDRESFQELNPRGFERLKALNLAPEGSNRGLSELLSLPTTKLRQRLGEVGEGSEAGPDVFPSVLQGILFIGVATLVILILRTKSP